VAGPGFAVWQRHRASSQKGIDACARMVTASEAYRDTGVARPRRPGWTAGSHPESSIPSAAIRRR